MGEDGSGRRECAIFCPFPAAGATLPPRLVAPPREFAVEKTRDGR